MITKKGGLKDTMSGLGGGGGIPNYGGTDRGIDGCPRGWRDIDGDPGF